MNRIKRVLEYVPGLYPVQRRYAERGRRQPLSSRLGPWGGCRGRRLRQEHVYEAIRALERVGLLS